jgi:cytochrome o ubiquinol oxidase subunit I
MFGRLTLEAFKHDMVAMGGVFSMVFGALFVLALITYLKRWKWLWKEWLTSVDAKRIGVMYCVVATTLLLKGLVDAGMMRTHQAISVGDNYGFLTSDHYQQVFTAHGTVMIFFVAMGYIFGLLNLVVPLQIGARDVAYPFMNSLSFYLYAVGALLVNLSLAVGEFSAAGWLAYPPLSGLEYNPGVGVDYWIWSLQISGLGSTMSGINFLVTILRMRCPGMTLMKMPIFCWASLCSVVLVVFAFPVLTATLGLLTLDRTIGTHFFTADFGGNPMMFVNLIWAWGHPEVYILMLPAFGTFSEVVATLSSKRLFGYTTMVCALVAITFLSFIVWVHHFFTMGAGPNVNAFFGVMTMIIAVPTGVKIFNWLMTMYRGKIKLATPILWFIGFVIAFTIGGMTGVLLSVPAVDFQMHNSLFLVAHFHNTIIGGVLFGLFAAFTFWFPKFTGFPLNEKLGKIAFFLWIVGFIVAFMPLYLLGMMGATRRLDHYEAGLGWQPFFITAAIGVGIILLGALTQVLQVFVSIRDRNKNRDLTGDPWNGRTLEWSTSSPPPFYNFAFIPEVHSRDAFWEQKQQMPHFVETRAYEDIHMPKNTPFGLYIGAFSFLFSFGVIWYISWLWMIGLVGAIACLIMRLSDDDIDYYVSKEEVREIETKRLQNAQLKGNEI